jgi:hypothetical protein
LQVIKKIRNLSVQQGLSGRNETKNGDLSIVLSGQGTTGDSLTGTDPENMVGD